jgi:hypothetical protein
MFRNHVNENPYGFYWPEDMTGIQIPFIAVCMKNAILNLPVNFEKLQQYNTQAQQDALAYRGLIMQKLHQAGNNKTKLRVSYEQTHSLKPGEFVTEGTDVYSKIFRAYTLIDPDKEEWAYQAYNHEIEHASAAKKLAPHLVSLFSLRLVRIKEGDGVTALPYIKFLDPSGTGTTFETYEAIIGAPSTLSEDDKITLDVL